MGTWLRILYLSGRLNSLYLLSSLVLMSGVSDEVLTLDAVLVRAAQRAPAVLLSKADADLQSARAEQARVPLVPTLAGSAGVSAGVDSGPSASVVSDAGLSAKWLVFDFGRTAGAVRSADLVAEAASRDVSTTGIQAAVAAGSAFLSLTANLSLIEERKLIAQERTRLLEIAQARVDAGAAAPVETIRARVSLSTAMLDVSSAEAAALGDATALARALGIEPAGMLPVVPAPALEVDDDPTRASDLAERKRPELEVQRLRLESAEAAVASVRASAWPWLTANAAAGARWLSSTPPANGASEDASVGAVLSVPLYDPSIAASVSVSEAQVLVAKAELEARRTSIRGEAAQAAILVRAQKAQLSSAEELARQADQNYAQAAGRYQLGAAALLELVDAETQQSSARLVSIQARSQLEVAKLRLLAATGALAIP